MTTDFANDNRKVARGSLANALAMVLEYRNRPDSPPDPLRSGWSTDPSTVIQDGTFDGDDEPEQISEDLLLEITPSISQIVREVKLGETVRSDPEMEALGLPPRKNSPVVAIGRIRFSDGNQFEQALVNGATGVELKKVRMKSGAMLGTAEKLGGAHGGDAPAIVTISNTNLTARLQPSIGVKIVNRPYTPATRKRRKGRSYTPTQSRGILAAAIANTPVMPAIQVFPPGVASGTARYSDQFVGMKIGSTGKGGAPSWIDEFVAMQDHKDWQSAIRDAEPKHMTVIQSAMSAGSLSAVSPGGTDRGARKRGLRLLVAANDNLAINKRKFAA